MSRFFVAIEAITDPFPLSALAEGFAQAVAEAETDGDDPEKCPAVLLLGGLISFRTHGDVRSMNSYQRLLDECRGRIDSREIQ